MDLGAEMARPFPGASGDGEVSAAWAAATAVFLAAETGRARPVDPVIWGDEERMKRELVACTWAKAVASMAAVGKNTSSSSPWPSTRRRGVL